MIDGKQLKSVIKYLIYNNIINNQTDFAQKLGYDKSTISGLISEKKPMNEIFANKVSENFPVNKTWLLTGEGEMINSAEESEIVKMINHEHIGVPYYDIDVTASIVESFSDVKEKPAYYVNFQPFNDCDAAFPVYGESMLPYFHPGDMVFVKSVTNINSMLWGESYLIITNANCDNLRTIKNVYISDDRQSFILRSTNPRFAGDTIIACTDVLKIFLVKGSVNRKLL